MEFRFIGLKYWYFVVFCSFDFFLMVFLIILLVLGVFGVNLCFFFRVRDFFFLRYRMNLFLVDNVLVLRGEISYKNI